MKRPKRVSKPRGSEENTGGDDCIFKRISFHERTSRSITREANKKLRGVVLNYKSFSWIQFKALDSQDLVKKCSHRES